MNLLFCKRPNFASNKVRYLRTVLFILAIPLVEVQTLAIRAIMFCSMFSVYSGKSCVKPTNVDPRSNEWLLLKRIFGM